MPADFATESVMSSLFLVCPDGFSQPTWLASPLWLLKLWMRSVFIIISSDVWLWEACNYWKLESLSRAQPKSMRKFVCFITADAYLLKPVLGKSLDSFSYCWSPEAVYKIVTQNRVMPCRTSSTIWISEYIIWSRVWRSRSNSSGRVRCKQMKQWVVASGPSPWWNWMKVPLCTANGPISLKQNVIVNGVLMFSAFWNVLLAKQHDTI